MEEKLLTGWLYEGSYEQPLAKPLCQCKECGGYIYSDEDYYEIFERIVCEECINVSKKFADD